MGFFFLYVSHIHGTFFVPIFFIINQELLEIATKNTVCYMELLQNMPLNFDTYASISTEITRGQIYSLFHENIWISQLLIEVKNSSNKQKNPHDQLIWDRITFQRSIYHSFHLKSDHILLFIALFS